MAVGNISAHDNLTAPYAWILVKIATFANNQSPMSEAPTSLPQPRPPRQSNMELLRCVAMFLVLVVHSDFGALGVPTAVSFADSPLAETWRVLVEAVGLMCVNLFVIISGYFGIRLSMRSACNFLFQVLFWAVAPYLLLSASGLVPWDWSAFGDRWLFGSDYWFPQVYATLMLVAPALNLYADSVPPRRLALLLLAMLLVEGLLGGTDVWEIAYRRGYGLASFVTLYLFGRYARLTRLPMRVSPSTSFMVALIATLGTAAAIVLSVMLTHDGEAIDRCISIFTSYASPFVLVASMAVSVAFARLHFQSRIVNWLGASAFSVYLIHANPHVMNAYFFHPIRTIYHAHSPLVASLLITAFLLGVYLACVLLDQLRRFAWQSLLRLHK